MYIGNFAKVLQFQRPKGVHPNCTPQLMSIVWHQSDAIVCVAWCLRYICLWCILYCLVFRYTDPQGWVPILGRCLWVCREARCKRKGLPFCWAFQTYRKGMHLFSGPRVAQTNCSLSLWNKDLFVVASTSFLFHREAKAFCLTEKQKRNIPST